MVGWGARDEPRNTLKTLKDDRKRERMMARRPTPDPPRMRIGFSADDAPDWLRGRRRDLDQAVWKGLTQRHKDTETQGHKDSLSLRVFEPLS